jgi:hypothetical protein
MENSTNDPIWDGNFDGTISATDVQMAHSNFDLWDEMILSNQGMLNDFPDSLFAANPSIDSIMEMPQDFPNIASSNQEPSDTLGNETISPNQLVLQSYMSSLQESNTMQDIQKELKELRGM